MAEVAEAEQALELADEALARFDVDGVVAHLSAAIRALTASDEPRRAAMACLRMGDTLAYAMGNLTASRAWFARAWRLVEEEPPCVEQGWVAVAAMGCEVDDPATLLEAADLALDRARRFGDVNLETKALADAGLAQVQSGRVAEGMALLDEAMALACGPADDTDTAAKSVCSFFTACYHATDFGRAGSWADLLRRHGLIGLERGGPVYLSSHCDSVQAALLVELGRWGDAEAVLLRAKADFEATMHAPSWHPDIALADLRVRQGRYTDAESLLLGKDQAMQALLPAARLHLARGDHDLARAAARRGLRVAGRDRLRAVELLTVLVDAELARGEMDTATAAAADLMARTGDLSIPALQARTAAARARVLGAADDLEGALEVLERALDRLDPAQHPWLHASLLLEVARLHERTGDDAAATLEAGAAAAALGKLDVVLSAEDAGLLDRLALDPPRGSAGRASPSTRSATSGSSAARPATLARDGRWWIASCEGTSVRLPETKGLRYLAELLAHPGVERHALDLVDRIEGPAPRGDVDRRALGDAGPLLDGRARAAYRHRIEELRGEADDALAEGRLDAAEGLQEEVDQLVAQLAQAFGLGGRDRRAASAAERARLNVTRALRSATAKLTEALPGPGGALDRRLRTGLYCVYQPGDEGDEGDEDEVRWIVQS